MTLHMTVTGAGALCGERHAPLRVSLEALVRFHPITYRVMRLFGCRDCGAELRDALRSARRIA